MIRGGTAVIVQDERFAQGRGHEHGRYRREQESGRGRREEMDDVCAPQLAPEQRPIAQLSCDGAKPFDGQEPFERLRRYRIDRDQPCMNVRVALPAFENPLRLDGVAPENAQRRRHHGDVESSGPVHLIGWMHRTRFRCK